MTDVMPATTSKGFEMFDDFASEAFDADPFASNNKPMDKAPKSNDKISESDDWVSFGNSEDSSAELFAGLDKEKIEKEHAIKFSSTRSSGAAAKMRRCDTDTPVRGAHPNKSRRGKSGEEIARGSSRERAAGSSHARRSPRRTVSGHARSLSPKRAPPSRSTSVSSEREETSTKPDGTTNKAESSGPVKRRPPSRTTSAKGTRGERSISPRRLASAARKEADGASSDPAILLDDESKQEESARRRPLSRSQSGASDRPKRPALRINRTRSNNSDVKRSSSPNALDSKKEGRPRGKRSSSPALMDASDNNNSLKKEASTRAKRASSPTLGDLSDKDNEEQAASRETRRPPTRGTQRSSSRRLLVARSVSSSENRSPSEHRRPRADRSPRRVKREASGSPPPPARGLERSDPTPELSKADSLKSPSSDHDATPVRRPPRRTLSDKPESRSVRGPRSASTRLAGRSRSPVSDGGDQNSGGPLSRASTARGRIESSRRSRRSVAAETDGDEEKVETKQEPEVAPEETEEGKSSDDNIPDTSVGSSKDVKAAKQAPARMPPRRTRSANNAPQGGRGGGRLRRNFVDIQKRQLASGVEFTNKLDEEEKERERKEEESNAWPIDSNDEDDIGDLFAEASWHANGADNAASSSKPKIASTVSSAFAGAADFFGLGSSSHAPKLISSHSPKNSTHAPGTASSSNRSSGMKKSASFRFRTSVFGKGKLIQGPVDVQDDSAADLEDGLDDSSDEFA